MKLLGLLGSLRLRVVLANRLLIVSFGTDGAEISDKEEEDYVSFTAIIY